MTMPIHSVMERVLPDLSCFRYDSAYAFYCALNRVMCRGCATDNTQRKAT